MTDIMNHNFDMYYDTASNRSPTSQRQGALHKQNSRNQFEPHNYLPSGLYTADDHVRYDGNRFGEMRNATIGGYGGGYDMGGQSWNAGAFNSNTLNGFGGTGLRKPPSRGGRSGIPSVCSITLRSVAGARTNRLTSLGWTSNNRCQCSTIMVVLVVCVRKRCIQIPKKISFRQPS